MISSIMPRRQVNRGLLCKTKVWGFISILLPPKDPQREKTKPVPSEYKSGNNMIEHHLAGAYPITGVSLFFVCSPWRANKKGLHRNQNICQLVKEICCYGWTVVKTGTNNGQENCTCGGKLRTACTLTSPDTLEMAPPIPSLNDTNRAYVASGSMAVVADQ